MDKKIRVAAGTVAQMPTGWAETVLICRKCSRKLDGGFGADGGDSLKAALRASLRRQGRRCSVGIIEVGCFGVCPKGAVIVARSSAPGDLLIVGAGADPTTVMGSNPASSQGG